MSDSRLLRRSGVSVARGLWLSYALCLGACASTPPPAEVDRTFLSPIDRSAAVECAPFARALSGVQLTGAAADWWSQSRDRYTRSDRPAVGGVLVFRRSARLADGHVAVVSRLLSERQILVTQANWVRGRVIADMPVIDVSPANDWTLVRVWWPPAGQMGATAYPTHGFILPDRPLSRDELAANTPTAIEVAMGPP